MKYSFAPLLSVCENRTSGIPEFKGNKEYLSTGNLDFDKIINTEIITYNNRPSRANRELEMDDVICARMQNTIKVLHIDAEQKSNLIVSTGFIVLHPKENFVPKYLKYYLLSNCFNKVKDSLCNGATQKAINDTNLNKIKIPLPSLPEQKRIVEILEKADNLRKKRQEVNELTNKTIQSIFLEMFGDPKKNENKYKISRLRECITIYGGYAFKSNDFIDNGIPLIRIGNVNKEYFNASNMVFLPEQYSNHYNRYLIYPSDIVISLTGTTGKDDYANVSVVNHTFKKYFLNQRVAKLEINDKLITKEYLTAIMKHPTIKKDLLKKGKGIRQANISNNDIFELEIPLPPISKQYKFTNIVQQIESIKEKQQESEKEIDNLFNSLMQKYFSS